jgi:hypothetical protein
MLTVPTPYHIFNVGSPSRSGNQLSGTSARTRANLPKHIPVFPVWTQGLLETREIDVPLLVGCTTLLTTRARRCKPRRKFFVQPPIEDSRRDDPKAEISAIHCKIDENCKVVIAAAKVGKDGPVLLGIPLPVGVLVALRFHPEPHGTIPSSCENVEARCIAGRQRCDNSPQEKLGYNVELAGISDEGTQPLLDLACHGDSPGDAEPMILQLRVDSNGAFGERQQKTREFPCLLDVHAFALAC